MESIKDKVAIIGMGCTQFGERWDKSASDLIIEAPYEAYEDAGIDPKDIQAAWVGTLQTSSSGVSLAAPLKLKNIPVTRVAADNERRGADKAFCENIRGAFSQENALHPSL